MKKTLFLIAVSMLFSLIGFSQEAAKVAKHRDVKVTELSKVVEAKKNVIILDVRTPTEVKDGKIKGATVIDWKGDKFAKELEKLDKNKIIYVYCASGRRSKEAQTLMIEKGFVEVHNLLGGMNAWKDAGLGTVEE